LQVSNNDNAELSDVCPRLAKIYIARGDYKKALSVTSRWAKDDDIYTADDACNMQGKIYELLDRKDLADRQYKEAIAALDKKNLSFSGSGLLGFGIEKHGDLLFRLGDIAAAKSDWQRAIGAFEKGLNRSPSDGSTLDHSSIAKLYEKLGDRHKRDESYCLCIEDLDEKIRATPNDAENYYRRGGYWEELSDYPSAMRDLQTAKRLDPESAVSYDCDMARILLEENKVHEALTAYLAAARTDEDAIVDEGLAQALELSGQHAKAVAAADRAINYDGDFGDCYEWRAKACQSLGDKKGAATGFKIAKIFKDD
jgi:tetratricopeptide (TPR) repeat protein